jgi:hypothetical protein
MDMHTSRNPLRDIFSISAPNGDQGSPRAWDEASAYAMHTSDVGRALGRERDDMDHHMRI